MDHTEKPKDNPVETDRIKVSGIDMEWNPDRGTCTFEKLPVAMMWVDTTLAGLMSGVQAMVGTARFLLALQSEGRKSVETDWQVISAVPNFPDGFKAIANIAAVAGWGNWELTSIDREQRECRFRVKDNWEARYQKALGVCWGSGMLAGKMAGYCSKLFGTNCWAEQTAFIAGGDAHDEFVVKPSERSIEQEIDNLLASDEATRADMAVALGKLEKEIAERMRIEESLREGEEKYRGIFDESVTTIYLFDTKKNFIDANQAGLDLLGYSREELLQMSIPDVDADPVVVLPAYHELLSGGRIINYEHRLRRKDGTVITVLNNSRAFNDHNGKVVGMLSTLIDITERKQAEELLNRFQLLVAHSRDIILLVRSNDGRILEANEAATKAYGYNHEQLLSMTVHQLRTPETLGQLSDQMREADEHGILLETIHRRSDGSTFPVEVSSRGETIGNTRALISVVRDITERKQAEEALRESELRWQFALEGAGDGLWDWNVQTNEVFFSRQWKAMLGFEEHEITNMLGEWETRVHPEDKDGVFNELSRHLDGHSPVYVNEHRMLCKDGTYKWILDRGKVVSWTEDGKPFRVIGIHSDISKRKRSEQALKASEKRLRRAELVAQVGNWEFMLDSMEVTGSDGARAIYGIREDSRSVVDIQKLPLPEYRPMLDKALQALIEEGKSYNVEYKIRRPTDGKILDIHSVAEYSPQKRAVFGVIQDITDRKMAEADLRASEEKYREVIENAHDAIFIAQDGLIKFPNPRLANLSGYSLEELTQKPFVEFVHPEDRELVANTYRSRLQGEVVPHTYSFRALNKAGDVLWVELSSVLLAWEGRPASLNFLRDITVEKRLESQLVHAQKMEAVGTLAGGIAHDFNNLLQAVQGYAEFLLLKKEEGEPGYRELHEIVRAAKRGGELTRQLLTFSRRVESKLQPVDLNRIVKDLRSMLDRTIPKMIKIELHLAGHLHPVNADFSQLEQVLMNLAVNARDAMPDGGTLRIETSNVVLDEDDRRSYPELSPGRYVLLAVRDTGQGMDSATLENIFDPFFTTKEVGKGTGLGLAIVYGIVKSHCGHIKCVSRPGEGTAFEIYLPAAEHSERASSIITGTEVLRGGHETILLVDDDDSLRDLGRDILETCGYTALSAPDGESALQIYQECGDRIDLVILDLIMPVMGGEQCLQKLLEINPAARVVIASGYSSNGETEMTPHRGAKAFIQKPYDVRQMLQLVRDVLDG